MSTHGQLTISIKTGSLAGTNPTYAIDQSILIGKDAACTLVLEDRGVSRKHCRIETDDQGWKILDLESTNGISVRGIPIGGSEDRSPRKAILLRTGDDIMIGDVLFHLEIETKKEEFTEILLPKKRVGTDEAATEMLVPNFAKRPPADSLKNQPQSQKYNSKLVIKSTSTTDDKSLDQNAARIKLEQPQQQILNSESIATVAPANPLLNTPSISVPGVFRNYHIEKRIGAGGMGEVFLAFDLSDSKIQRAIKFLKLQSDQTSQDRARFLREMEITFTMQHSALIRCVDCGEENRQLFIAMDYCNGGNLCELLTRAGKINTRRAIRLMDRLLSGVEHAHALGIVHRDLKPSNILLHKDQAGKYQPKISDFGLAKSYLQAGDSGMTVSGSVGGSWAYMPREQLTNFRFVAPQCDVWSLGAIFYECLTLRLPRPHEKGSDPIRTILQSDVVPIEKVMPDIHPALAKFLMKSLGKEPQDRFTDASAMRVALREVAQSAGVEL